MTHLLIRTYEKDDYIARLCYESWIRAGFIGEIIFYSEQYESKWLKNLPNSRFIYRDKVMNFGGQLGARCLMNGFRQLNIHDNDVVISCDTDILIKELPNLVTQIGGKGGMGQGFIHFSGQLMMFRGSLIKIALSDSDDKVEGLIQYMVANDINICDDSYLSYRLKDEYQGYQIFEDNAWLHEKLYHLEPRQDWDKILCEY